MLTAVPVAGKRKAQDICNAFIKGAPASAEGYVFYGVNESNARTWHAIRKAGCHNWYYIDNSYFDEARGVQYRVTKNAIAHMGTGESDGRRFAALGIQLAPWREEGSHILVCPQSDSFMQVVAGWSAPGDWKREMANLLRRRTKRTVIVRPWMRDKREHQISLPDSLVNCWGLVTYSSAAAVTAIMRGIPAWAASGPAAFIDNQERPEDPLPLPDRERWAGVLADNQFTLDEMKDGTAWQMVNKP